MKNDDLPFVEFLQAREKSCREMAAGINPCADPGDAMKIAILARANEFKACAEELERLSDRVAELEKRPIDPGHMD